MNQVQIMAGAVHVFAHYADYQAKDEAYESCALCRHYYLVNGPQHKCESRENA